MNASTGQISFSRDKNVVLFQPTIPKEFHICTVKNFLEENMHPNDLKNASAVVSKVCGIYSSLLCSHIWFGLRLFLHSFLLIGAGKC